MRRGLKLALLGAIAVCLSAATWVGVVGHYESEFEVEVELLRAAGVRVDLGQFNQAPVSDAENAAILFREARDGRIEKGLDTFSPAWELDSEETDPRMHDAPGWVDGWAEVAQWIGKQGSFFQRVERAMSMPRWNFGVDHRQAWNAIVESIPLSQSIADTFQWRVRVAQHRGEPAMDSLGDCRTVLRWSKRIDRGFVISYAVVGTVDAIACDMIERVASMAGFDPVKARGVLDPLLVAAEDEQVMWDAFDGERALMIHLVRTLASWGGLAEIQQVVGEERVPSRWVRIGMTAVRPALWSNGIRSLELWAKAGKIIRRGDREVLSRLKALADDWESDWKKKDDPPLGRLSTLLFHRQPWMLYRTRLRHLARLRVTRVGLSCLEFRQRYGRWPESVSDIVDPFTGSPFVLVPDGEGGLRIEAVVPWLGEYEGEIRELERTVWTLTPAER